MAGSFKAREVREVEPAPGIPVTELGDPLNPTLVLAEHRTIFERWCRACKVNPKSERVSFMEHDPESWSSGWHDLGNKVSYIAELGPEWEWAVFLCVDPREDYLRSPAYTNLDNRRKAGNLTRAWVFTDLKIEPDIQPSMPPQGKSGEPQ